MSEGISETEYENEVERQANQLSKAASDALDADEYDTYHHAVVDLAMDVLDAHQWFVRTYHGPADHGAIIEYAAAEDIDPVQYGDLTAVGDSEDPTRIVNQTAYMMFEAHVIETALARARGAV